MLCASAAVMRPRSTASLSTSSMRSRVSITISSGPIRFLRSASRSSATVLASTPALRAPRAAVRAVVFAALRAFCWRPRAWPPFLAAAVRLADDARELRRTSRWWSGCGRDALPADDLLADDLLRRAADLLRELADERRLDPLDFACSAILRCFDAPPCLRSPSCAAACVLVLTPWSGTISPRTRDDGRVVGQPEPQPVAPGQLALAPARAAAAARPRRARARAGGRSRRARWASPRPKRSRSSLERLPASRAGRRLRSPPNTSGSPADHSTARARRRASTSARRLLGQARATRAGSPRTPSAARQLARASRSSGAARAAAASVSRRCSRIRPGARTRSWFEPPSLEAIRSGFRSASAPLERRAPVARGEHAHAARAACAGRASRNQRGGASWSSATSHRGRRASRANSSRSGRLTWAWVASRSVTPSRRERQREERRVGREVAPVVEVPAEDSHWHGTS